MSIFFLFPPEAGNWTAVSSTSGPYRGRVQMFNHLSPRNASLLLTDLSKEDQGFYVCDVDNHAREFDLLVEGKYGIIFCCVLIIDSFSRHKKQLDFIIFFISFPFLI